MNIKKRGQITLFIVLGIVILIIIGVFVYISSNILKVRERPGEIEDIEEYVRSCIEVALGNAKSECFSSGLDVHFAGEDDFYSVDEFDICIRSWFDGINVGGEVLGGLDCSGGFGLFEDEGYEISEEGEPAVSVNINSVAGSTSAADWNLISLVVNYPIKISRDGQEFNLNQFYVDVGVEQ